MLFRSAGLAQAFRAEFGSGADFVIAAAGQLIPRKGHQYLLQAVADLKDRYPQFGSSFLARATSTTSCVRRQRRLDWATSCSSPAFVRISMRLSSVLRFVRPPGAGRGAGRRGPEGRRRRRAGGRVCGRWHGRGGRRRANRLAWCSRKTRRAGPSDRALVDDPSWQRDGSAGRSGCKASSRSLRWQTSTSRSTSRY